VSWSEFVKSLGLVDPVLPVSMSAGGDTVVALYRKRAVIWSLSTGEIQSSSPVQGDGVSVNSKGEIALPDASGRPLWLGGDLLRLGWKAWTYLGKPHYAEDLDPSPRALAFRQGDRIYLADPMKDRPQQLEGDSLVEPKPTPDDGPCMDACMHQDRLVTVQRGGLRSWEGVKSWTALPSRHDLQTLAVDSDGSLWTVGLPGPVLVGPELRLKLPKLTESPKVWALPHGVLVETYAGFFFREPGGRTHTLSLPGRRKKHSGVLPVGEQVLVGSEPIGLYDAVGARLVRELAAPSTDI